MENKFLSGFISIIGCPNVGKSTLLNALAGEKVAIVSNKPQTTRNKINAVITTDNYQMVFLDTPGIHTPKSKLGEQMLKSATQDLSTVDIVLLMVSPVPPAKNDIATLENIKNLKCPVYLVINKIDTVEKQKLLNVINEYSKEHKFDQVIPISAIKGENLNTLLNCILSKLPEGPKYYDDDYITDQPEKQIAAEIIREKALHSLLEEVPHGIAVIIESMKKRNDKHLMDIDATIYCEKESHKGIIIGKKGAILRKIGQNARTELEERLDITINLQLWVKVKKDWRNSDYFVKNFS